MKVLPGLRHHRLVCGNHQHDEIDPTDTGKHVLDETLVAGNVDKGEVAEVRETEIDGNAALLLFFQAVRICPGQCPDERALAVVDVPGGADDDRALGHQFYPRGFAPRTPLHATSRTASPARSGRVARSPCSLAVWNERRVYETTF